MYHGNADLASLLQRSLYQLRQYRKRDIQAEPTNIEVNKVLDGLNDKILEQCQQVLTRYQTFCDEYSNIDIEEVIGDINPELWNSICLNCLNLPVTSDRESNMETDDSTQRFFEFLEKVWTSDSEKRDWSENEETDYESNSSDVEQVHEYYNCCY